MNCSDIQRILDDHGLRSISAAERLQFDTHLAGCAACFGVVSAQQMLSNEVAEAPRDGLLGSILGQVEAKPMTPPGPSAPLTWQSVGGLAALAALVVVLVVSLGLRQPVVDQEADSSVSAALSGQPSGDSVLAGAFVENEHFVALPEAGRLGGVGDRIAAWIFFMWSCLHCYELEPILSEWIAQQDPAAIDVVRIPVAWNDYAELHARAFYTAGILGISERVSDAFFAMIHENGTYLDTRDAIRALFLDLGVDGATFDGVFDSERVDDELRLARFSAAEARIDATPTLVVGAAYKTSPAMAGSGERMLQVADWLIAGIERQP